MDVFFRVLLFCYDVLGANATEVGSDSEKTIQLLIIEFYHD